MLSFMRDIIPSPDNADMNDGGSWATKLDHDYETKRNLHMCLDGRREPGLLHDDHAESKGGHG